MLLSPITDRKSRQKNQQDYKNFNNTMNLSLT